MYRPYRKTTRASRPYRKTGSRTAGRYQRSYRTNQSTTRSTITKRYYPRTRGTFKVGAKVGTRRIASAGTAVGASLLPLQTYVYGVDVIPMNLNPQANNASCWYELPIYDGYSVRNPYAAIPVGGNLMDKFLCEHASMEVTIPNNYKFEMEVMAFYYISRKDSDITTMATILGSTSAPGGMSTAWSQYMTSPMDAQLFGTYFNCFSVKKYIVAPGQAKTLTYTVKKGKGSRGTYVRPADYTDNGIERYYVNGLTRGIVLRVRYNPGSLAETNAEDNLSTTIMATGARYQGVRVNYRYKYRYLQVPRFNTITNGYNNAADNNFIETHAPGTYEFQATPITV